MSSVNASWNEETGQRKEWRKRQW